MWLNCDLNKSASTFNSADWSVSTCNSALVKLLLLCLGFLQEQLALD